MCVQIRIVKRDDGAMDVFAERKMPYANASKSRRKVELKDLEAALDEVVKAVRDDQGQPGGPYQGA